MNSKEVPLRDLLLSTKDGEWGRSESGDGLAPMAVIRGTDFEAVRLGNLDDLPLRYIPEHLAARKALQPSDIVIETAGGTKDRPTGRTVFLRGELIGSSSRPLTCASFSRYLRVNPELAEPEYVFWYLQYLYSLGEMEHHQVQHTGVARFQYTTFAASTAIPLPGRERQRSICDTLRQLDEKIALDHRMNRTLESIARATFKSWFVDFDPVRQKMEGGEVGLAPELVALFPDCLQPSGIGPIPLGWSVEEIGGQVRAVGGSTPSTKNPEFWGGEIRFATPKDLAGLPSPVLLDTERSITQAGAATISSGILKPGVLLMSSRAPIGYLAIPEVPVCVNQGFIAMICDGVLSNHFVLHWVRANMESVVGNANGTTFLEISKRNFRPLPIVVPPRALVEHFTALATSLHKRVVGNLRESRGSASLRDALLPRLLSGDWNGVGDAR